MTLILQNQLVTSTAFDQDIQQQAGAPLRSERIEAAFGEAHQETETKNILASVTSPRTLAASPRGIRFITPAIQSRLIGFVIEQRWQGYVTGTQGERFQAIVYDSSNDEEDVEEVELDRNDVSEIMRGLIEPGAI